MPADHESTYQRPAAQRPVSTTRQVSLLLEHGGALQARALREGVPIVVGRGETCEIMIDDASLSRAHAKLELRDGRVHVEDLGSTNGTLLNGQLITEAFAGEGDILMIGPLEVRVAGSMLPGRARLGMVPHGRWVDLVDAEIARARLFGRAMSIVALRAAGADVGPRTWPLRVVDACCQYAPGLYFVLLPELDLGAATGWTDQARAAQAGASSTPVAAAVAAFPAQGSSSEELITSVLRALRDARPGGPVIVAEHEAAEAPNAAAIILSPATLRLHALIERIARTSMPALVLGETGSGKELTARAVHDKSPRAAGPFVALNCATIPATLIESVLFGHERGAFTGADKQAPGVFEQASGGTLFLDEVGELSAKAQAALLRVLETMRVMRVGSTKEIAVDVRVVAATHRDLSALVANGDFREDLLFRLDALTLCVPPLRERPEEIAPLARAFLSRARKQWGSEARDISPDALDALLLYRWPGNVRQLRNVIERATVVATQELIELEDLPAVVIADSTLPEPAALPTGPASLVPGGRSLTDLMRDYEIGLIRDALAKAHGNQAQAARILGIPRRTLANKVHAYGLL